MNPPKVLNVRSRSLDMVRSVEMRIGLCKGRHDIVDNGVTVTDFVFEEAIESPHDFQGLYESAYNFFKRLEVAGEVKELHLFVTGLTSALVATLQAYRNFPFAPELILRHFDRDSSSYSRQPWETNFQTCELQGCGCE